MPTSVALAVELGRVADDGEQDAQQGAVGDDGRIEGDLDGFGVAGPVFTDGAVIGRAGFATGVANDGVDHTFDALEDRLDAPEAAAGEDSSVGFAGFVAGLRHNNVVRGGGDGGGACGCGHECASPDFDDDPEAEENDGGAKAQRQELVRRKGQHDGLDASAARRRCGGLASARRQRRRWSGQ